MAQKKVLGICGSLRAESWNLKLLRNFLDTLRQEGAETTLYPSLEMPLMNEDLEKLTLDSRVLQFRAALKDHPIVVIASPEYNGSFSPALKNAIDWASRPPENLWTDKIAVLLSASPGALGGARGLIQVRAVLSTCRAWVIPEQVQCSLADKAFTPEGKLVQDGGLKQLTKAIASLNRFADKMFMPLEIVKES
jgi:NAD(P)H-dependent FMN reductase